MDAVVAEIDRLTALRALKVFGSPPEDEFDGLVQAAAVVCETPISSLVLVEADQVWLKAKIGIGGEAKTHRQHSFCNYTIRSDELLEICDTLEDPRFVDNPYVTAAEGVRFYAGAPVRLRDGHRIGAICVLDRRPRKLSPQQREVLRCLAVAAARALEARQALQTQSRLADALNEALVSVAASEARYRQIADATSDVITQLDLDLVRRYVSPASRAVLGYAPDELIGLTPIASAHPEDADRLGKAMRTLLDGGVPDDRTTTVNRMRHKSGHWVWVEAALALARDAATGTPQHIVCVLRDVTQRIEAERLEGARVAAERDAVQKAEFLSNMSHELRTPLTGILGIHDLLKRDPELNSQQRHYVAQAFRAGQSLMNIINDVLDFSKIEAGQLALESVPVDLHHLIEAACDCVHGEAHRKSLRIETFLPERTVILGDPTRLRQILLNLLSNAVKFTMQGHVWIEVRYDAEAARLTLSVSDTGMGMATDQLDTVFERFRQAGGAITRQYGGTGLGLAISRRLATLMGGRITVRSIVGAGSTFTLEIPAAVAPRSPVAPLPEPSDLQPLAILLVEDNALNQEIVGAMLRLGGHAVTLAVNGQEAVETIAGPGRFDVVLMDVQMPMRDGLWATRAIRDRERAAGVPAMPIIGLTANAGARDLERCLAAGMNGRVTKPVDWPQLFRAIGEITAGREIAVPTAGAVAGPAVMDAETRGRLARIIGAQRFREMDEAFTTEVERDGCELDRRDEAALATLVHGWIAMAGHLGFFELSGCAAAVERTIRAGEGATGLADLQVAVLRAVAAARRERFDRAA